jgi:hypothetical protein
VASLCIHRIKKVIVRAGSNSHKVNIDPSKPLFSNLLFLQEFFEHKYPKNALNYLKKEFLAFASSNTPFALTCLRLDSNSGLVSSFQEKQDTSFAFD